MTNFKIKYIDYQWYVTRGGDVLPKGYASKHLAECAAERLERESKIKLRNCMCCGIEFKSENAGNRHCSQCRRRSDPIGEPASIRLR